MTTLTQLARPAYLCLLRRFVFCISMGMAAPVLADITAQAVATPSITQMRAWVEQMK